MAKMTTEEFIKRAREVHGDKYDYSKVEYVDAKTKVCIICPIHGEFWQMASNHLSGKGCSKCGKKKLWDKRGRITTEEFIRRAKDVHGDKYDYSKTEYINCDTNVIIICPKHGIFKQTPTNHLKGRGCYDCGREISASKQRLSFDEFITKAREIHGKKYDYSKVEYVDTKTKVCIICSEHGEFWQEPNSHLQGRGCPKCVGKNKTLEEFIIDANKVHGNKFDYSRVIYTDATTKVCIICPEHGEFWQTPSNHLRGQGCKKCAGIETKTTEDFITKAKEIHGDKYDYSKTQYVNTKTPITIICNSCKNEFKKLPQDFLINKSCPICGKYKKNKTTEDIIREAKKVHGDKYDYSETIYKDSKTPLTIICHKKDDYGNEHGRFFQLSTVHLSGCGCSKCSHPNKNMTTDDFIKKSKIIHGDKYDYSKVKYVDIKTKVCIICPDHGEFWQTPDKHLMGRGCSNCQGLRKQYKFNLLEEFESEYAFRAFLANNDINILTLILQNIEPKYEPIKKDIQRVLVHANETDPIQSLREKYSSETDDSDDNEPTEIVDTPIDNTLDWDNDDIVNDMISQESDTTNNIDNELSMSDIIRNDEEEIKVINRLDDEHLITPEVREYIMAKYLNDRRRAWMANRDNK